MESTRFFIFVALCFLVLPIFISAEMPPDGIYLIRSEASSRETLDFRPEYISDEVLTFYSCIEGAPRVFHSTYCKDDPANLVELIEYPWIEGCFISAYDLNNTECSELIIQSEYEYKDEILKFDREVAVKDVDSIPYTLLDSQETDGGWGDPISTAWALWALSEFDEEEGQFENNTYVDMIEGGLTWLKENRDDDEKCWPKDPDEDDDDDDYEGCSIAETAEIVALLSEANFASRTDWMRIIHDASLWLQTKQNLFNLRDPVEDDLADVDLEWTAYITGVNWTDGSIPVDYSSCLVQYTNEVDLTMQIVFGITYEIKFNPIHDERLNILCTPNSLPLSIRNDRNEYLYNTTTGNVSYHIPGPCWDDNHTWQYCDIPTTNFASIAPLDSLRTDVSKQWLIETIGEDDFGMHFNTTTDIFDSSWFLYKRFASEEDITESVDDGVELTDIERKVTRWILYNQNNDGSWGNASDVVENSLEDTAMAAISLASVNNGSYTQYIKDASVWISQNKPADGWDTVVRDALTFLAFSRSAKPFMKSSSSIFVLQGNQMDIELSNPSSFNFNNLEFVIEGNLSELIHIDEIGSLPSDYFKKITLHLDQKVEESTFGYISVLNDDYEIARFPVLIQSVPEIKFKVNKPFISVYNGKGTVNFGITKSDASVLDCNLYWNDPTITSKQKFKIDKQTSVTTDIVLSEIKNQDIDYEGRFDCLHEGMNLSFPITLVTKQFETIPFTVAPNDINITNLEEVPYFTIYNNVDKEITVTAEFETEDPYLMIDNPQVTIEPLGTYEVYISNFIPVNESIVWSNVISVHAYDREESVMVDVVYQPKQRNAFVGLLLTFILVFGLLGGSGYALYTYRTQIIAKLPKAITSKLPESITGQAVPGLEDTGLEFSKDLKNLHPMEKKITAKNFVHVAELIKIMKGLGKDDEEISQRLETEGYSKGEVTSLFKRVTEEMDTEDELVKEEKFMKLMKGLDQDTGTVRNKLKQDGFTDDEIKEAFKQAEDNISKKRGDLDKKLKDAGRYDISAEDAEKALTAEDDNAGLDGGAGYSQSDAKADADKEKE